MHLFRYKGVGVCHMLGEYQRYLVDLDLFTPNEIACLVLDLNPKKGHSKNLEYNQIMRMIETSIKAGNLELFNDEGVIAVQEVKRYLGDKNYKFESFNAGLRYADKPQFLDEVSDAVYNVVSNEGLPILATRLGIPPDILRSKIVPTYKNAELTLTEAVHIMELTNDFSILQAIINRLSLDKNLLIDSQLSDRELEAQNAGLKHQINQTRADFERLQAENVQLKDSLAQQASTGQASQHDDKELAPNSQSGVARLLYAILTEHNYDLSPPKGKGNTNDVLVKASQVHGAPVSANFVAPWLIRAHQLKINLTK